MSTSIISKTDINKTIGSNYFPEYVPGLVIGFFLLGFTLVDQFVFFAQINRLVGIFLSFLYFMYYQRFRPGIPTEVKVFGIFIIWSFATGVFASINLTAYMASVRTITQLFALIVCVAGFSAVYRGADFSFASMIFVALVLTIYSFYSYDFSLIGNPGTSIRVSGYLHNPNTFAFYSLLGIVGIAYFWEKNKIFWVRLLFAFIATAFAYSIVFSGARKSIVALFVFILAWMWFSYRQIFFRRFRSGFMVLLILTSAYLLADYAMENTIMGARYSRTFENPEADTSIRLLLYEEGLEMFAKKPITGVGLGNFAVLSSRLGSYAHSDYIEVLATTGGVGFILYFSLYFILWRRLNRVKNQTSNHLVSVHIGVLKALIITLLVIGFGRPNFDNIPAWMVLSGAIGYFYSFERFIEKSNTSNSKDIDTVVPPRV